MLHLTGAGVRLDQSHVGKNHETREGEMQQFTADSSALLSLAHMQSHNLNLNNFPPTGV